MLTIDSFDGAGARNYTAALDPEHAPRVHRRLNRPSELRAWLVADTPDFIVPAPEARVVLSRADNSKLFTGYVAGAPQHEYLGWGEHGPVFRYTIVALSDEWLLDRKALPARAPFVSRTAGDALKQTVNELAPGAFDTSGVQDVATIPWYATDPRKSWSEHAAEVALRVRASYRAHDGALTFAPVGTAVHAIHEASPDFCPGGLKLAGLPRLLNDITVIGRVEPRAYVRDYFLGDGLSLHFDLADAPFSPYAVNVLEEEYKEATLSVTRWSVTDSTDAVSVSGGKLRIAGGAGDGQTTMRFAELLELGGALVLQHGDVIFAAASDGVLGGLYHGAVGIANCLAGFRITPSGADSAISAMVNGAITGTPVGTIPGHRYALTTRLYASEIYRTSQLFHSSAHPGGSGRGGEAIGASVRVVLEVHDVDPANPGTIAAPSTVLYDGVISPATAYCIYALVYASDLHCAIAFTRLARVPNVQVRSAIPGQPFRTRLLGSLSEGGECSVADTPELRFLAQYVPEANEQIVVSYRGRGRAAARIRDESSIAAQARNGDDGVRSAIRGLLAPAPRTSAECETAALALLEDSVQPAWAGEYEVWNEFLPADDVFPGDSVSVNAPSQAAIFEAIVREVQIECVDPAGEHSRYKVRFANDAAEPLAFDFDLTRLRDAVDVTRSSTAPATFLPALSAAEVTQITSTTVTMDAGADPPSGGGIEVRRSDRGWSPEDDRNLVGRFAARSFTVPRLSRAQAYYLRQYDGSSPPNYSRYSALLHVDWPL